MAKKTREQRQNEAVSVKCWCGWRGRRTHQFCECDWACSCTGFGNCPKCRRVVHSVARLLELAEADRKYEAWAYSPAGREALGSLIERVGIGAENEKRR